jgi:putative Mg2+ transporter-C (MgtC) family protein
VPVTLSLPDLILRLVLSLVSGALVGFNRGERGRPAGMRTTILVCLAASFSMLLANALLNTVGKSQTYFTQMDVMRLPLGILTGMGFLGAGAIIRKGSVVVGLTTAATLWFVTVMGFCFGAGQHTLGITALVMALFVIWVMKHLENHQRVDRRASLTLVVSETAPQDLEIRKLFQSSGYRIAASGISIEDEPRRTTLRYELIWRALPDDTEQPKFLMSLAHNPTVASIHWSPQLLDEQSAH